ncbi:MAG: MBL fold metallo-hydrolase [Flavobacteriaceae bacterium]|nr:MBL fold metallo-hydrolase [Flavobacteriaceae bacterium]
MRLTKQFLALALVIFTFTSCTNAQNKEVKIEIHQLTERIYMLTGQGGNIGLFIGDDGVFMIDDQYAPLSPKILAAIKTITNKPVSYLINTHWHGDHTGGNENMQKVGATIIAHENVRKRMSKDNMLLGKIKPASPKEALPVITFTDDMMFHINGDDVLVSHVHNAHTDGDSFVYFSKNNVIHMGDLYFQGKFPFIDLDSGGSIDGYINAVNKILMIANDTTKIIPGHRNISNKSELTVFKNMLVSIRSLVQSEIDKGKMLEEVTHNTELTKEFNSEYGGWFITDDVFRATVYKSLNAK